MGASQCSVCGRNLSDGVGFVSCALCDSRAHPECRHESGGRCPKCGGDVSGEVMFVADTPFLDFFLPLLAGAAVVMLVVSALILSKIPFDKNASGQAGIAFYFVFMPSALLCLVFTGVLLLTWYLRHNARRPRRQK